MTDKIWNRKETPAFRTYFGRPIESLAIEHPPNTRSLPSGVRVMVCPYLGLGVNPEESNYEDGEEIVNARE